MGEYKSRVPAMVAFEKDDEEKDLVVRELEEAVHKYIKTGVKSKQLDKVVDVEVKFQKGYKGCFDIERLIQTITSESKKEVLKNAQLAVTSEGKSVTRELDSIIDVVLKKVEPLLNGELDKMLSEVAYLYH